MYPTRSPAIAVTAIEPAEIAESIGTGFTYRGQLTANGVPVNETCDFEFGLWDESSGGSRIGISPVSLPAVVVTDGLFSAVLDFGGGVFTGEARWLQIAVNCGKGQITLSPRQQLRPVPYALYAATAGSVSWSGLQDIPGGFSDGIDDAGPVNQYCPEGQAVVGFDADGNIVCNLVIIPTLTPTPTPVPVFDPDTVFVSPSGNDGNSCLSFNDPCHTISAGSAKAQAVGEPQVVVATGDYFESVTLVSGVDLLGGYNASYTDRDSEIYQTTIKGDGTSAPTVSAESILATTVLEGFVVEGPDVTTQSGNSIAVYIADSNNSLTIRSNIIYGGGGTRRQRNRWYQWAKRDKW